MESFEFDVTMKVNIFAFNVNDAKEAVVEALEEIPGAVVAELLVDESRKID